MSYTRRTFGTAFVSLLCLCDVLFTAFVANRYLGSVLDPTKVGILFQFLYLGIILTGPYKLGFHLWMLIYPKLTAGKGDTVKLNILVIGTVLLNFPLLIFAQSYFETSLDFFVLSLPSLLVIFERFVYGTDDDTGNCLKHWKPWMVSTEEDPLSKA